MFQGLYLKSKTYNGFGEISDWASVTESPTKLANEGMKLERDLRLKMSK
jgi:hypothetical protein